MLWCMLEDTDTTFALQLRATAPAKKVISSIPLALQYKQPGGLGPFF